jgi:hypothetical protein
VDEHLADMPARSLEHRIWVAGAASDETAARQRMIETGVELFQRIAPGAEVIHHLLPDDDAVLVVHPVRGGGSIHVASDGSVLYTGSAVSPHLAIEWFRAGQRTPIEKFAAQRPGDVAGTR